MAARGNSTNNSSSSLRPPGLSSGFYFGSPQEQRDYERYLLSQFTVWQKERRRCFYLARRSLKKKTHSTFSTCVFSSSSVSSSITCLFPQVQRSTSVEVSSHRILKQKKFTTLCTSTWTWASGPLKLTPWVEFTKRKSPLKLPSSQPPPRPPLSRGSKPSTQPTFRETSPSTNFSNIPSARPASSRANILARSALSKETDSKGPTTQSTQSTSRVIPCNSNFSNLNPNLKNSSSFSSSPSASSSSVPPKTWEQFMKDTEDFEPHWFVKKVPGTSPSKSPGQRKKKRK